LPSSRDGLLVLVSRTQKKNYHPRSSCGEVDASQDPDLSAEGKARAEKLAKIVKRYKTWGDLLDGFQTYAATLLPPMAAKRKLKVGSTTARNRRI
jgi:hypothetical protein